MTEQTQAAAPTVEQLVATFGDLDDAALQKLHDDEKAADGGGRTTLLDAIHREQQTRTQAAEQAKVDQEAADAKAREAGYADAATQRTAEEAAEKAAAKKKTKRTAAKKAPAKKADAGFDVAGDGAEYLRELATEGGTATITLGDASGPDANLKGVEATLAFTRGKPVNRDRVNISSAGMPGLVRFTHAYAIDGKTVLGKRELASPLPLAPGEQVAFNAGTLAF